MTIFVASCEMTSLRRKLTTMTSNSPAMLARNRALLAFLFDSGCRADELLNVRIKDLTVEKGDYKVRLEVSKTFKRTMLLPIASRYLGAWLDVHPARTEPGAGILFLLIDDKTGFIICYHMRDLKRNFSLRDAD